MSHDFEQIEIVSNTVSSQEQGAIRVKLHRHDCLVMSHEVSNHASHLVMQVDLVLISAVANLQHIKNGNNALLHLIPRSRGRGARRRCRRRQRRVAGRHRRGFRRENIAVKFGHALSQLASDIDAPSGHGLASVHNHASARPVNGHELLVGVSQPPFP